MLNLFIALQIRFAEFRETERGATAVEYGLLVALIAGVIIAAVGVLGGKINTLFTRVSGSIN